MPRCIVCRRDLAQHDMASDEAPPWGSEVCFLCSQGESDAETDKGKKEKEGDHHEKDKGKKEKEGDHHEKDKDKEAEEARPQ